MFLKIFFFLFTILLSINTFADSATPASATSVMPAMGTPAYYLVLARQQTGATQQHSLLLAATEYVKRKRYPKALQILQVIVPTQLNAEDVAPYQLLVARVNLLLSKPAIAINILQTMGPVNNLSIDAQTARDNLLAVAYEQVNRPLDSITTRLDLALLLSDPQAEKQNLQEIWKLSQQLSDTTLNQLASDPTQPELQGWAALTLIARQDHANPQRLIQDLRNWQTTFPKHPASVMLAQVLPDAEKLLTVPKHIAVLLPMQGDWAPQAQAIWQGFLYAYYQTDPSLRPMLSVYDTQGADITDVYEHAVKDGADFIVGPLLAADVTKIVDSSDTISTLALNYSSDKANNNVYEFGLSSENDANQIADRMTQDGLSRIITITLDSPASQALRDNFIQQFNQRGGTVITNINVNNQTDLDEAIKDSLDIPQSYARKNQVQAIVGGKLVFTPRRRQDVDGIFLNVLPAQGRQIIPLLQYYYASEVPVYATSLIYNGVPLAIQDSDLNGIIFPDMPWVNAPTKAMRKAQQDLQNLWPQSYQNYAKLYAIGIDAYNLIPELNRLKIFPQSMYAGDTGDIYLSNDQHLYRQLSWAQFDNGRIVSLPATKAQA